MTRTASGHRTGRRALLPWVGLLARLAVGGVFLLAGVLKVGDPDQAAAAVQAYRLLPPDVARIVGYALPTVEILLGLLLVVGLFTRLVALLGALVLVAFVVGVTSVWVRGYSIDCGCFGGGGDVAPEGLTERYTLELVRDGALLVCALLVAALPRTALSADRALSGRATDDRADHEDTDHDDTDHDDTDHVDDDVRDDEQDDVLTGRGPGRLDRADTEKGRD